MGLKKVLVEGREGRRQGAGLSGTDPLHYGEREGGGSTKLGDQGVGDKMKGGVWWAYRVSAEKYWGDGEGASAEAWAGDREL